MPIKPYTTPNDIPVTINCIITGKPPNFYDIGEALMRFTNI